MHTAEAFASADLKGRITEFTLLRKNADMNTEAFDNFSDELAFTFESLAKIAGPEAGKLFKQASVDIKNGLEINTQELLIQADAIKSLGSSFKNLTHLSWRMSQAIITSLSLVDRMFKFRSCICFRISFS